jgi:hypothetical protein
MELFHRLSVIEVSVMLAVVVLFAVIAAVSLSVAIEIWEEFRQQRRMANLATANFRQRRFGRKQNN